MLKNLNIQYRYTTGGENAPFAFFTDALSNSSNFDLGLGFFSTASFNVLSTGFAKFISNGGTMRLYINQYLSEEDYVAITTLPVETLDRKLIADFESMRNLLSKRDKHFFNCLSYLISTNRISIKVVVPKKGGIAHQKFGIFTDKLGDKIAFSGSTNFTASALLRNLETIDCFTSWENVDSKKRIESSESDFNDVFNGISDAIWVYEPIAFKEHIKTTYISPDIEQLLAEEETLINSLKSSNATNFTPYEIETKETEEPQFPYTTGPFEYQIEAYKEWVKRGYKGIFAMATGTGKTITSLNCVLEEYKKSKEYRLLILVPTLDLAMQWVGEVKKFNYKNIFEVGGDTDWRASLTKLKNDFEWGIHSNFVIISTYDSFVNEVFQKILYTLCDGMILIADEAHNVGRNQVKTVFENLPIEKRIALSATPRRAYDIEGTQAVERFFADLEPYCYSYSMEKAIKNKRLMEYLYFPKLAYLSAEEMTQYCKLTKVLLQYFDKDLNSFKSSPEVTELLMKRKRIIHKAQDKYRVFEQIVDELVNNKKAKYCFVYAPEGKDYRVDEFQRIIETLKNIVNTKYSKIRTNTYVGGDKDKKEKLQSFADGQIDMMFAMKCLDEGVDVPRAEVGIFTSSTGNPRQFIQRRGRLLRTHPDKRFARIYDIIVVPDFGLLPGDSDTYAMERSQVRSELMRVAYFASLASNYNFACQSLQELLDYYNLEISTLIKDLQQQ